MTKGYTKSTVDKIKQMLRHHSIAYTSRVTDIPASSIANIRDGKYFIKDNGKKCNKVSKDYFNWGDFKNIV